MEQAESIPDVMRSPAYRDLLLNHAPGAMFAPEVRDPALSGLTASTVANPQNYNELSKLTFEKLEPSLVLPSDPIAPPMPTRPPVRPIWSNGYSCVGYEPDRLVRSVKVVAQALPAFMNECEADAIAVRGSSGVLFAGMLMTHLPELSVIICRKPGEHSHSDQINITGGGGRRVEAYVFVDDFILSGSTLDGVEKDLNAYGAECTGIVEYQGSGKPCPVLRHGHKVKGRACLGWQS